MKYPGLAYVGSGKISGLYGLNESIHDQKSIGLQHLYIDDYETDYIYSATSFVKLEDRCYYGDRMKPRSGHPLKTRSIKSDCHDGFAFVDEFEYDEFKKIDSVYCSDDYTISFECELINTSSIPLEFEIGSLVITTENDFRLIKNDDSYYLNLKDKNLKVLTNEKNTICRVSKDTPSGFMYHGIQDILFNENLFLDYEFKSCEPISASLAKKIILHPKENYTFKWCITTQKKEPNFDQMRSKANLYWSNWLKESNRPIDDSVSSNLIALKAINMNGFIPADLTGHYFANDDVCFYVRDALHGARAFLYSGHFFECRQIIELVAKLSRRSNHEIFQRYNSKLMPDEGANNNVFSQIDFIGYLLRLVADYYHLTGDLLIDIKMLMKEAMILDNISTKNGLYGPEGGVNEGVYGPAFITSTNMFIIGGLAGLLELLLASDKSEYIDYIKNRINTMVESVNKTFLEEEYFAYGYVEYHNQLVKRYDTPQLFGASLGYPIDDNYKTNFYTLTRIATYFGHGYGYSEQEYHDGPWIFNTSFAAQNAYILDDLKLYKDIILWLEDHKNDYGLLPEAIDARNEKNSFINPLMWANAEYICAKNADIIATLRKEKTYDFKTL